MSKENQTAGKTAQNTQVEADLKTAVAQVTEIKAETVQKEPDLVDLFADDAEDGGTPDLTGADLTAEQVAQIASIYLYDCLYVVATDKQRMLQAHAKIEKNVPGKHRKGIKRTHSSIQAWTKACAVASAITGEQYHSSADTLNDPQKTASRMAGFVRNYLKFKQTAKTYAENSNGYKLAKQMKLI